jgi:branched-chain amino acid transport system permease protein
MITLAFSQVVYYVILGIEEFGSDDGLTINASSAFPLINLGSKFTLYWTALAVLLAQVVFFGLLKRARFGLALAAAKESERRVRASGLDPYGYKLVAYVLAGMLAALSGFLYANLTSFVTPDTMKWTQSGEFLFIIILGGMIGPAIGPLAGAVFYVFLEETLSGLTVYWHFWFGAFLVVAVMIGTQRFRRVWKFFAVGWRQ